MKLYFSATSPYARKVRVTAAEAGCAAAFELVTVDTWKPGAALEACNPLARVPTLVCEDGLVLYDSPVICEYLDATCSSALLPASGQRRWDVLRLQALADGLMDLAVERFVELARPASRRDASWLDRTDRGIRRIVAGIDAQVLSDADRPDLGGIALACALGYLDLRYPELAWRGMHPALARWMHRWEARPSMASTRPPQEQRP